MYGFSVKMKFESAFLISILISVISLVACFEDVQQFQSSTILSTNNGGVTTTIASTGIFTTSQISHITSKNNDEISNSEKPVDPEVVGNVIDNKVVKEEGENTKFQKEVVTDKVPVNTIGEIKRILTEKKHSVGFDFPLYTIITACVALSLAALCITVFIIWKANKHVSTKSRLSNLDQKNLNQIEICMDKKGAQNNVNMCFSGIPPNGEIWREIKSTTPTVF